MRRRFIFSLIAMLILSVAACSSQPTLPTTTPIPPLPTMTPPLLPPTITSNADWQPVYADLNGFALALVPPGCFTMGNDDGRRDESPAHQVCFERPFWIDRYEVTNVQFGSTGNAQGDNYPRENILWSEARDFCAARDARLPTEAEWEYAARGPSNLLYPWGNELVADNLVFDQNSPSTTAPVGSKPAGASWVGALDMSGNVFEFVSSAYAPYPYAIDGRENLTDPELPRVYRGGINSYIDNGASATTRFRLDPDERNWFIGFRCAQDY